jgi:hypothetical protein
MAGSDFHKLILKEEAYESSDKREPIISKPGDVEAF